VEVQARSRAHSRRSALQRGPGLRARRGRPARPRVLRRRLRARGAAPQADRRDRALLRHGPVRQARVRLVPKAKLMFLCGKMAAGKSTLARDLAERERAVLLAQDELLDHLYPGEIVDIPDFVKYSARLRRALEPHVCAL